MLTNLLDDIWFGGGTIQRSFDGIASRKQGGGTGCLVEKGFPSRARTGSGCLVAGFECLPPATVVTPVTLLLTLIGYKILPHV